MKKHDHCPSFARYLEKVSTLAGKDTPMSVSNVEKALLNSNLRNAS
jgi:hypothetical protein